MGGANGSRECAPDDELRDTHRVTMLEWRHDQRSPQLACRGSFFFTVNLAQRHLRLLTEHIDKLRNWEHTIRDDNDFTGHADYVHINPVKHRLVARVGDWPYSSFHRMVKLGVYPEDWAGDVSNDGEDFGERA